MHAGLDHLGRQDRCVGLVGRNGGDNVRTLDRFVYGVGVNHLYSRESRQVAQQLERGIAIDIEDADFVDAQHLWKASA